MNDLPTDILLLIADCLDAQDLARLSQASRLLRKFVEGLAWRAYITANPRHNPSISTTFASWNLRYQARYTHLSDRAWERRDFSSHLLSTPWTRWQRPVMTMYEGGLIVSHGQDLQIHGFEHHGDDFMVRPAHTIITSNNPPDPRRDITGVIVLPFPGASPTLCVARADGTITRAVLNQSNSRGNAGFTPTGQYIPPFTYNSKRPAVKFLTSSENMLLALAGDGAVSLYRARSPWAPPSTISLPKGTNPWSGHLCLSSSTPFAAIGANKFAALSIYPIEEGALGSSPMAALDGDTNQVAAVYAICQPRHRVASLPWGTSEQIVLSGWYDGKVRVHDLRDPSRSFGASSSTSSMSLMPLKPVMTLHDRTGHGGAIYSLAAGGGSGTHVVAGSAIHGIISIWDVRSASLPSTSTSSTPVPGWSVYPPSSDWSPTYSVSVEGSRVWGVGQWGPFVLDFSPDLQRGRYPSARELGRMSRDRVNSPTQNWREERLRDETVHDLRTTIYEHNVQRSVVVSA